MSRLIAGLRDDPMWPWTTLIVTSDHGEGLGEHGVHGHGRTAYEPLIAVPAVLVTPGLGPGRYPHLVSSLDIPATVYGAFGLREHALKAEGFGRSWLRLRADPTAALHDFIVTRSRRYSSGRAGSVDILALVTPHLKLVASLQDGLSTVFDPTRDPQELHDFSSRDGAATSELQRMLARYVDLRGPPARF